MKKLTPLITAFLLVAACLAGARFAPAGATLAAAAAPVPQFNHVFTIVMENKEYGRIIGDRDAPFINSLADQYGLALNYTAVIHPSLPDYMALTGGDTFFTNNCRGCTTSARHIADQIGADPNRTWMAYMESMPAACTTTDAGRYVAKHNPFVHYSNIVNNRSRCESHVVPMTTFLTDLRDNHLADYVWITPDNCSNMHDCSVSTGDSWLADLVPQILNSPAFENSVLFLLWDEGSSSVGGGGHVPAIIASPMTPAGLRVATPVNHYDVLRTVEEAWGYAPLGKAAQATPMSEYFVGR